MLKIADKLKAFKMFSMLVYVYMYACMWIYICIYLRTHVDVWNAKIRGHAATMVEGSLRI